MNTQSDAFQSLLDQQKDLENDSLSQGAHRFREKLRVAAKMEQSSTMGGARRLLQLGLEPLTKAIQEILPGGQSGKRGRKHIAARWVERVGADAAAYMTLRALMDSLTTRSTVRNLAISTALLIQDELRFARLKEKEPALFQYRLTRFATNSYVHMARTMDSAIKRIEMDTSDLEMTQTEMLQVGVKLLDLAINVTGMFKVEHGTKITKSGKAHNETLIVPTEETLKWVEDRNASLELLHPVSLPMVVPPLPWKPGVVGGYRFALRGKHKLVRAISKTHVKNVVSAEMPLVYGALNRIQETAWRINPDVVSLLEQIVEKGGGMAGIPLTQEIPLPPKPHDIDTNEEAKKQWKDAAHRVHDDNFKRRHKVKEFGRVFSMAKRFLPYSAIWFPCNLDFRGRIYPVVSYLQPQGDDLSKGLLTFAQGKPLGPDGAAWLALHGANCLGDTPDGVKLSKQTLNERIDWIVNHTADIEAVVEDPFTNSWWAFTTDGKTRDEAIQFYAFCVEWAAWAKLERQGIGETFVSSLPCAMDGSCNGLQHFSAMLRDEVGAKAVNVLPSDRPQDIYQYVADEVMKALEVEAADHEMARLWLSSGLVNRKLTKRPTMTFGYGSKLFGFSRQLEEYLKGLENWADLEATLFTRVEGNSNKSLVRFACIYMASKIWDALGSTVVAAAAGMAWMRKASSIVSKTGRCVEWVVPMTGFPVRQEYHEEKARQLKTTLAGAVFWPVVFEQTAKVHTKKQANAIAPNFVHSLDAAALMYTVHMAQSDGVENFAMVHDSYGTLAADCPVLAGCTRQAFFSFYSNNDVVRSLYEQLETQAAIGGASEEVLREFPVPPERGNLDLSSVLQSDYFFS